MSAPTLYILAADLTKMQVLANIDEADVGRMRPGQNVTFRVDAFPTETFIGLVEQVRLQPTVVQNVVTYSTVIAVPNDQLKLKPGMTANVNIEVARRSNVLRMPAAALRFRPTEEMFQVLNQEVPPELQRGRGGVNAANGGRQGFGGGRNGQGPGGGSGQAANGQPQPGNGQSATSGQPSQPSTAPSTSAAANPGANSSSQQPGGRAPAAEARGGGDRMENGSGGGRGGSSGGRGFDPNMTPEERRKRMEERMANMTPEERERFQERMRERMANGGGGGDGRGGSNQGTPNGQGNASASSSANGQSRRADSSRGIAASITPGASHLSGATTIDALFGPLPTVETRGRAWLYIDKKLKSISLRLGVSDGTFTEILNGEIKEGQEVVTNMVTGLEPKTTPGQSNQSNNPLMGPQRGPNRGGGPGGGGGGRGR
jgi:hypothetical protein